MKLRSALRLIAELAVPTTETLRYGWISPDGERFRCGYELHNEAARELLDSFYPGWEEKTTAYCTTVALLELGWTRVTLEDGTAAFECTKINDSLIEYISTLPKDQNCVVEPGHSRRQMFEGTPDQFLEKYACERTTT